ncbi:MAG: DUF2953 domain-containing protein [Clostridium sp.]|nr:DUF2953 domain-containing protein [Clostridium sp.]
MPVWGIALIVLAALILPLCVRVRLVVDYDESLRSLKLRYLFLSFRLYPQKEKPPKKEKPKKKTSAKKQKKKEETEEKKPNMLAPFLKQEGIGGIVELLKSALAALGGTLNGLRKGLLLHELRVYASVTAKSGEAADTAILYGKACAVLYPLVNGLMSLVKTRRYDVDVSADYLARETRAQLFVNASLRPIRVLGELILLALRLLKNVLLPIIKANNSQDTEKDKQTKLTEKKENKT